MTGLWAWARVRARERGHHVGTSEGASDGADVWGFRAWGADDGTRCRHECGLDSIA
jgi:hypothetical protein